MTGSELIKWIHEHKAEDFEVYTSEGFPYDSGYPARPKIGKAHEYLHCPYTSFSYGDEVVDSIVFT